MRENMRYNKRLGLAIAAMILLTVGCGGQENKINKTLDVLDTDMWKTDGFVTDDEVVKEQEE